MSNNETTYTPYHFHPLNSGRWDDFERLFGKRGAYGGYWCMWWRTTRSQFEQQHGEGNQKAMKEIVNSGEIPGILLYSEDEPVGWCSVAPRERYASLNRSHVLKRLDEIPVWSVVCFYVANGHRNQGIMGKLIQAAIEYVQHEGWATVANPANLSNAGVQSIGQVPNRIKSRSGSTA